MKRLLILPTAAVAATLVLAACSSSGGGSNGHTSAPAAASPPASSAAATGSATITISNFAYSGTLTVTAGEKVTVVDKDSAAHTLTSKGSPKFDTGNVAGSGGTGTFIAPSTPGKYQFGCTYHANMAGTLTVTK